MSLQRRLNKVRFIFILVGIPLFIIIHPALELTIIALLNIQDVSKKIVKKAFYPLKVFNERAPKH